MSQPCKAAWQATWASCDGTVAANVNFAQKLIVD